MNYTLLKISPHKWWNAKFKRKYLAFYIIGALIIYLFHPEYVLASSLGSKAGGFLRIGLGADLSAMGGCGTALSNYGTNWHYNPAALGFQKNRQVVIGYRSMSLDRKVIYIDYSSPLKGNASLGFGFLRAGTSNIDARDSNGERFDILSNSDNLFHGSFSIRPYPTVSLGISIKWMINNTPHIQYDNKSLNAYGMGFDIGIQYKVHRSLILGAKISDLNAKYNWSTYKVWGDDIGMKEDQFPTLIRLGWAYEPYKNFVLTSDIILHKQELGKSSEGIQPHFGTEWKYSINNELGGVIRAGVDQNEPTFGFGFDFILLEKIRAHFDYAFVYDRISPSGSHLFGWTFSQLKDIR